MKNALIAALVALLVASVVSGATKPQPLLRPGSPPSQADINRAQTREIKELKQQVALIHENLVAIVNAVNDIPDTTDLFDTVDCITGAAPVYVGPGNVLMASTTETPPDQEMWLVTYDANC